MPCLSQQIAAASRARPLVISASGSLSPQAAASIGAAADLSPDDRLAISVSDPRVLIETLLALDGQVETLLLVSYAQPPEIVRKLADAAGCSAIVTDRADLAGAGDLRRPDQVRGDRHRAEPLPTRWLMTTSGTTGVPKIIAHSLKSLSRTVYRYGADRNPVWGLLYDPTRFAGMQVTLQALIGGGTLVAPDTSLPLAEQVAELARHGCTFLSATPTLWRRLMMVPGIRDVPLGQITLGGEIVDQGILDALRGAFPDTRMTHIYASTEAGVGFAVNDGRAGFPAAYLKAAPTGVKMKLVDGILWLRPPVAGAAGHKDPAIEIDAEGYVCSGDRISLEGDRAFFLGRDNGSINVGGVKVFPEVIERVITGVPGVAMAKVSSKSNPITGALIVAEVQLAGDADRAEMKPRIIAACRDGLEREAVPAMVRFVESFQVNAAGKLVRSAAKG
ncbi:MULTISPECIES: AMP-binding protein [Actibacterium]|uniref:Acyl-CoA synthetase (AMP-forming)/AMP-acid ligase II n=1 Tax=Actibacterium naphthalenivorans TaxID=1614693 RepID=A0A840C5S5_9RHOB|nr:MULTISPECIES: class I adenylate-forming enzyme family protein [Actibacterium]MBB4020805.1 acyl-CoA synthetase (AMP-forming)/AMP-acid ligase II [Actibacterium naphthalenivorans]